MYGHLAMTSGPLHEYQARLRSEALSADPAQAAAAEKLHALHNRLSAYKPGNGRGGLRGILGLDRAKPAPMGLYLHGGVGRGKSMLMDLFFDGAPVENKARVHFHAFMAEIHEAIHSHRQAVKRGAAVGHDPIPPVAGQVAEKATLLCFDEFQVTDVADAMILGRLFEQLFGHGVVLVTTSNTAPDDLYLGGINRPLFLPFIDLIKSRLDVHYLDGARDHRLGRLMARPIYYSPLDSGAKKAMDRCWAAATAGLEISHETLTVKRHSIKVPFSTREAARFGFADLCGKPLGSIDFLALADRYTTIFVDGIPVLSPERRDEARRLVTLVDAVYEAGGLIVASAEAVVDDLISSGAEAAKFARTASRLHEMRSEGYLERLTVRAL